MVTLLCCKKDVSKSIPRGIATPWALTFSCSRLRAAIRFMSFDAVRKIFGISPWHEAAGIALPGCLPDSEEN